MKNLRTVKATELVTGSRTGRAQAYAAGVACRAQVSMQLGPCWLPWG